MSFGHARFKKKLRGGSTSFEEQSRAYFQERLTLFAKVMWILTLALYFAFRAINLVWVDEYPFQSVTQTGSIVHLAATACMFLLWLGLRRQAFVHHALCSVDGLQFFLCIGTTLYVACAEEERYGTAETAWILAMFFLARAVIVPSTVKRTLWLCVPSVAVYAWILLQRDQLHGPAGGLLPADVTPVIVSVHVVLLGFAVALAATTSGVTFKLRQRAYEAEQLGQYLMEGKIGEGGMGEVYRARHALLQRPTAIKLLRADRIGEETLARFEREVMLASRLTHPNSIRIYDYGHSPDGVFYYAMELLGGADLDEVVQANGALPPGRVIHVLEQACAALHEAHASGMVHRDIKPGNMYLCERGKVLDVVKVLDFGLAKDLKQGGALTQVGQFLGTPHYLSPEAVGAPGVVGPASDIYALGAVAYRLLTGRLVFDDDSIGQVIIAHLQTPPQPPTELDPNVPADLERIVLRCLEKRPEDRFPSVAELRGALLRCEAAGSWTQADARAWWEAHLPGRL